MLALAQKVAALEEVLDSRLRGNDVGDILGNPGHVERKKSDACASLLARWCLGSQAQTMMMPSDRMGQFFD